MNQVTFIPYESVGSIRMGSSREVVRNNNPEYREFKKNRFSKNTTDDYGTYHVFYTKSNCVEAVEIFKGIDIVLNDIIISSLSIDELICRLSDSKIIKESDSVNFPSYGLSISIQSGTIESYLIYAKGYWD